MGVNLIMGGIQNTIIGGMALGAIVDNRNLHFYNACAKMSV